MFCVVLALHSRERLGLYQGLSAIRNCNLGFAEPYKVFGRSAEPEGRFGSVLFFFFFSNTVRSIQHANDAGSPARKAPRASSSQAA